jgi:hypothetical protein
MERKGHVAAALIMAAVGIGLAGLVSNSVLVMALLCFAQIGVSAVPPMFWPLPASFLTGASAAAGIAAINSLGNLSGFAGPYAMGYLKDLTGNFTAGLLSLAGQDYIAAGQFRGGEQLVEAQQVARPGTILVFMEPIYKGGLEGVTPGSSCIANAYTSNHDVIEAKETGALKRIALHGVDATGIVHAMLLRIQALVLPVQTLVLSGH